LCALAHGNDRRMTAAAFVPDTGSVRALAEAASRCEGCELYQSAERTVFGAGPAPATLVLVGEQPGDVEDQRGEPFVGPAGRVLDRALSEAGLDRERIYVTNAVKHFRWKPAPRGKRRIHQQPSAQHITACRPWLAAELAAVRPALVVALGAVAGRSLFGPRFRLSDHRGEQLPWPPETGAFADSQLPLRGAFATLHPSAVLRGGDQDRADLFDGLVADLRAVQRVAGAVK
jgi:uracil-DNA glycosylase family protein